MAVPYSVKKQQLIQKAMENAQGQAVSKPASSGTPFANAAAEAAYAAAVPSYKVPVKTTTNAEKVTKDVSQEKKDKVYSSFPGYTKKRAEETKAEAEKAKSAVEEAEGQEFDWTDANQRKQHEEAVKQKKAEAAQADKKARQAEANAVYAADMAEINSLSEEERTALQTYADELSNTNASRLSGGNLFADIFSGSKMDQAEKVFSGKYDRKRLKELAETLNRVQNEEDTQKAEAAGKEAGGGGVAEKTLGTLGTFGANLVGSATGVAGYATELMGSTGRYPTLDPNNPGNIPNKYSEALRGQVVQDIRGEGDSALRNAAAYLYQGATSAADNVIRIAAAGPGALGLAAVGSFGQTLAEASGKGATPEQAVLQATANAALEVMTEKIPLDNLLKTMKGGKQTAGQIVKGALAQAGIEATSEEINFVAQLMAEAAILQEKSGYNQRIGDMVANGMSYQEAKEAAQKELWEQAKQTAIVSGISGGLSQAGASVATNLMTPKAQTAPVAQNVPQLTPESVEVAQGVPQITLEAVRQVQEQAQVAEPAAENVISPVEEFGRIMNERAPQQVRQEVKTPEQLNLEAAVAEVLRGREGATFQPTAQDMAEYTASLEQEAAPAEKGERFPGYQQERVSNPFSGRSWSDVGKRNVTAFMQDNPEIKNLFRAEAQNMLMELADTTRGERWYNDQTYYESGGEKGIGGVKRNTSDEIAELLDSGMTYEEIENGLNAIIRDEGAEQNAASKRIEFVLNDRLLNGHRDFYGSGRVPASSEYINQLREIQANKAGQEGFESLMQDADRYAPAVDTEKQYTDGGQLKQGAVGAAEQNFSGKAAYQDLLYEGNVQRDRPGDVRPMELPKTDVAGNRVSEVTGNVYGAKITTDELASLMEPETASGRFSYAQISNDQATKTAMENIQKVGEWNAAFTQWANEVNRGVAGAEMAARGALFLNHAAKSGDKAQWMNVLSEMQKLGTNTAQGLQAFNIIRNLKGTDAAAFTRITVQKMVDDMHLKANIQIDESLLDRLERAETAKERNAVISEIQQNVADQIPSTLLDKWTALRYTNMLGNLKTNVRNVAGNVGSAAIYRMKDTIATGIEAITSKTMGTNRTKSFTVDKGTLDLAKQDFDNYRGTISAGGKYGDRMSASSEFAQGVMDKRRIFKSDNKILDTVMKPMELYRRGTNWMMNNQYFGDEAFSKAAYSRALAGYLKANNVTAESFQEMLEMERPPKILNDARTYAIRQAQEATFHDNSTLAKVLSKVQKDTGFIGQGLIPFTKTPANVLTRAVEFSPLGIVDTAVKAAKLANGDVNITGNDVIDSLSKTITGTGLFALGAALQDLGILTAGPDDDEEKAAFDTLNGKQPYSIRLPGGESYTFDWFTPGSMPMFMGAELWDTVSEKDGNLTIADLESVFTSIGDPLIQMSMLQGLNNSLDNIKYADDNLGQFVLNASVAYLTQGLSNTLLGQIERSTEENRMTTYIDKDSGTPEWIQRTAGKLSQKIPGWDYQQMEYRDAWGQPDQNEGGILYETLSPGYLSKEKESAVSDELYRLREVTGENVFPERVKDTIQYTDTTGTVHTDYQLNPEELTRMQEVQGQTQARIISAMIDSPDYSAMSDSQKAEAVKLAYSYAREQGEAAAIGDSRTSKAEGWMLDMEEGKEADAIIRKVAGDSIQNSMNALTNAWDNGYQEAGKSTELSAAYDNFENLSEAGKKAVIDEIAGTAAKYLESRSNGVSHEDFLSAAKAVETVRGTGTVNEETGVAGVRDIDKRQAIANTSGLSDKEIDIIMRAYMSDYDPNDSSPELTEVKYDYIRQVLGLSPAEYAETYRAHLDNSKKADEIAAMVELGYSREVATKLYKIYDGDKATKQAMLDWYE